MRYLFILTFVLISVFENKMAFAGDSAVSVEDSLAVKNFTGGLSVGELSVDNYPGKKVPSQSDFPYFYADAGYVWSLTNIWLMGPKATFGIDAANSDPIPITTFGISLINEISLPLETDIYGNTKRLLVEVDGGASLNSLGSSYSTLSGPGDQQLQSWVAPSFRVSVSAYYIELAYQAILSPSAPYPAMSALTLGFRFALNNAD